MAESRDGPKSQKDAHQRPGRPARPDAAARFARAIARAEFGRFYWSGAAEQALRAAMKRKPKR